MSMLVGLLVKQVIRHANHSPAAGKAKYNELFVDSDQYKDVKRDVDHLLTSLGYGDIPGKQADSNWGR